MKKILVPLAIVVIALAVRLYRIDTPLADWHSWRQADTASVAKRYVNEGINLLYPKYDDLSSIPSGLENPQGYRMVEVPLIGGLVAGLYKTLSPNIDIHIFYRYISIAFSLGSVLFLYLLVNKLSGQLTASLAATTFALLPYNVFYSRVILPEVPLVFFSLAMLYFLTSNLIVASIFASVAFMLKPTTAFLLLPATYLVFIYHKKFYRRFSFYLSIIIAIVPFVLWRYWIKQFPEGIPANLWLLNGNGIRFKGAWFRWLFADRFGRLILGYFGLIPFGLGIIKKGKDSLFYLLWLLGMIAYMAVFATGNVQHDYYQIITIPIISIFIARGVMVLISPPKSFSLIASYCLLVTASAFMLAFSWFHIRDLYNINHPEIIAAGIAADKLLPPNAKVIAPYQGDTAFLYQTNRQGWPIAGNIDNRIKQGATHYISTTLDQETNDLIEKYQVIDQTDLYTIISLE